MITRTDYDHLSKLGLPRTEENAVLSRKCFNPHESLEAFRTIEQLTLSVEHLKASLESLKALIAVLEGKVVR